MSVTNLCCRFITAVILSIAVNQDAISQNAVINVTGSLIDKTCTVENKAVTLNFGDFYVNKIFSQFIASTSTTINLTKCSVDTTQVTASLSGSGFGDGFKNIGTASGVYIVAYREAKSSVISNNGFWTKQVDSDKHSVSFFYMFSLKRNYVNNSFETITPGSILSVINVTFSYS